MLMRVGIQNHKSIKAYQTMSLVASSLKDAEDYLIDPSIQKSEPLLPVAAIFGANASGKSNIISALSFLKVAILHSHSRGEMGDLIPRSPYLLSESPREIPTILDIDLIIDGVRYHYGFEATDTEFVQEWLYFFPNGRKQKLFERDKMQFSFGRALKGQNKVIAKLTRQNSLFLSAASQNGHEQISKIISFFKSIRISNRFNPSDEVVAASFDGEKDHSDLLALIDNLGTGIVNYQKTQESVPDLNQKVHREFYETIKKFIDPKITPPPEMVTKIKFAHRGVAGKEFYLDAHDESQGTRRLIPILRGAFDALDEGSLFIIDELDASLHTTACRLILELFSDPKINIKKAQLIVTLHDTNMMNAPFMRRDQFWFVEKDHEGASSIYSLSDFTTRKTDNLEKGYLQGRFGAVPSISSIFDL